MQIVRTMIQDGSVEMTLADGADANQAAEFVALRAQVVTDRNRPVAEAQLAALQRAQSAIAVEIAAIQSLAGRNA